MWASVASDAGSDVTTLNEAIGRKAGRNPHGDRPAAPDSRSGAVVSSAVIWLGERERRSSPPLSAMDQLPGRQRNRQPAGRIDARAASGL